MSTAVARPAPEVSPAPVAPVQRVDLPPDELAVSIVRIADGVWALCANGWELNRFTSRTAAEHSLATEGIYGSCDYRFFPVVAS